MSFPHHKSHANHKTINIIDFIFDISSTHFISIFSSVTSSLLFGALAIVKV
jgi:hypothetical protein